MDHFHPELIGMGCMLALDKICDLIVYNESIKYCYKLQILTSEHALQTLQNERSCQFALLVLHTRPEYTTLHGLVLKDCQKSLRSRCINTAFCKSGRRYVVIRYRFSLTGEDHSH